MRTIVHIGAHRTGTTSIQTALHQNQDRLLEEGICVITAEEARKFVFTPIKQYAKATDEDKESQREHLAMLFDGIKSETQNAHTTVYSEENLMGSMKLPLAAAEMGAAAVDNLRAMREFIGDDFEIVISIRNFATYFNSVFTYQFCKSIFQPFDHYRRMFMRRRYGWFQIVSEIREAFPEHTIRVVKFESYQSDLTKFFPHIGVNTQIALPSLHRNQTRSALAIQELEKALGNKTSLRRNKVRRIVSAANEQPFTPYQPWSNEEFEILSTRYNRHIRAIKKNLNVEFIET